MDITDADECRAFPATLTGAAERWFGNLPPGCITCFDDITDKFIERFAINKKQKKSAQNLLFVVQREEESLRDYLDRFIRESQQIEDLQDVEAKMALRGGLKWGRFSQSLSGREPQTLQELIRRAEKYINQEEGERAALLRQQIQKPDNRGRLTDRREPREERKEPRPPRDRRFSKYTQLKVPIDRVFNEARSPPGPIPKTTNTPITKKHGQVPLVRLPHGLWPQHNQLLGPEECSGGNDQRRKPPATRIRQKRHQSEKEE